MFYLAASDRQCPASEKRWPMSSLEEPPEGVRSVSDCFNVLMPSEGIRIVEQYVPKDTDIILAGPPKSGTTWVQHVLLFVTVISFDFGTSVDYA